MVTEQIKNVFDELNFEENKEYLFTEIKAIILNNGRIIVPNYLYNRFIILKNSIGIIYGESEPIGARLPLNFSLNGNNDTLTFPEPLKIYDNEFYQDFRRPEFSDRLRVSSSLTKYKDYVIESVIDDDFTTRIKIFGHFGNIVPGESKISFFNPKTYDLDDCILGSINEGIYHHFERKPLKKK